MGKNMETTLKRFILISLLAAGAAAASLDSSTDSPSLLTNTTATDNNNATTTTNNTNTDNTNTNTTCPDTTSCEECFSNTNASCIFVIYKETSQDCHPSDFQPRNDPIAPQVVRTLDKCSSGGDSQITTLSPPETTTAGTPTTTSNSDTSTSTTTTTTTPTTTMITTPTTPPSDVMPEPAPGSRGHFDGWSFFGGILLTLGIAAIGFVGFKYYKLRNVSSGGNYNRF